MLCCWLPPPLLQLVPVTRIETNFAYGMGGDRQKRREGRSEEKAEEKRRDEKRRESRRDEKREERREKMAGELSDGEDSVGHKAELVDAAADAEVDLRLPLRDPKLQDRPWEEISTHPGVLNQAAIDIDNDNDNEFISNSHI